MNYSIGIDLATSLVGLVLINEDKVLYYKEINLPKYSFEEQTRSLTYALFGNEFQKIKECINWNEPNRIDLFIEVSNFSNPKLTQRFSRLAGIVEFIATCQLEWIKEVKHFNANEWRRLFMKDNCRLNGKPINSIDREAWKSESIREFKKLTSIETSSDNIADAYFIAKYGSKCKGVLEREQVTNLVKEIKKMQKAYKKKPTTHKEQKIYKKFEELKELNEKAN